MFIIVYIVAGDVDCMLDFNRLWIQHISRNYRIRILFGGIPSAGVKSKKHAAPMTRMQNHGKWPLLFVDNSSNTRCMPWLIPDLCFFQKCLAFLCFVLSFTPHEITRNHRLWRFASGLAIAALTFAAGFMVFCSWGFGWLDLGAVNGGTAKNK